MYAEPELSCTYCCHPEQAEGFAAPLHADELKVLLFICSEKTLATPDCGLEQFDPKVVPVSLVTPDTVGKEPVAVDKVPDVATTSWSVPFPTSCGLVRPEGRWGRFGAVTHWTSDQEVLGWCASKQPCLGKGVAAISFRQ
jgi:hypothetical protein